MRTQRSLIRGRIRIHKCSHPDLHKSQMNRKIDKRIPQGAGDPPEDEEDEEDGWEVSYLQKCAEQPLATLCTLHLSVSACFWSWWRSHPPNHQSYTSKPFLKAKKFIHFNAEWVNVPKHVLEDLIKESQGAILQDISRLVSSQGSVAVPQIYIQEMFDVINNYTAGIPFVPSDSTNEQARGLGSMVAFWERMRNICSKVNAYNGPIFKADGGQRVTSDDLDQAMLSTRDFWFQEPVASDPLWDDILDVYQQSDPWPDVQLPDKDDLLATLLHTKDSAPGPDGLPYAAWRLLPEVTVGAMASCFYDIMEGTALPPLQVGVWIPKAKIGPEADLACQIPLTALLTVLLQQRLCVKRLPICTPLKRLCPCLRNHSVQSRVYSEHTS